MRSKGGSVSIFLTLISESTDILGQQPPDTSIIGALHQVRHGTHHLPPTDRILGAFASQLLRWSSDISTSLPSSFPSFLPSDFCL